MQDEKPKSPAAKLAEMRAKKPAPTQAAPVEPREKPMSVGGFAENALNDAYEMVKGLASLPSALYKAGKFAVQHPSEVPSAGWNLVKALGEAVIDPYKRHGVKALYNRPVTAVLDAVTLITLGGGAVARVGKLAGGVSRAKVSVEAAKAAGATKLAQRLAQAPTSADRLVALGEKVRDFPGMLARKGVDKAVLTASGGKWDLAKRRRFLMDKADEEGLKAVKIQRDMEAVGKKIAALSDEEQALWHKWRTQGASKAELAAAPKVAEALEAFRPLADEWKELWKSRALLDDATAAETLAKKFAHEVGDQTSEGIAKARAAIEAAEVKPIYAPALFESADHFDLDKILTAIPAAQRTGKVGMLEKYTGAKGDIKDPRIYVPRAIAGVRTVEARLRLVERTLQSGAGKNPAFAEAMRAPEQGIFQKYFDDRVRAEAAKSITDPTIRKLLQWEFSKTPHAALRLYDYVLGLFRRQATIYSPRWYVGNLVGDAILGELGGSNWLHGMALKRKGVLPPAVAGHGGMHGVETGTLGRLAEKASVIGNQADLATRAGLLSRSMAQNLKNAGLSFEAVGEVSENMIRSSEQFSNVQVRLQLLQDHAARQSPQVAVLDKLLARKLSKERKLAEAVQGARDKNVAKGLAPAVKGTALSTERVPLPVPQPSGKPPRNVAIQKPDKSQRLPTEKLRMEALRNPDAPPVRRIEGEPIPIAPGAGGGGTPGMPIAVSDVPGPAIKLQRGTAPTPAVAPRDIARMEESLAALRQEITNIETQRDLIVRDIADNASTIRQLEAQIPGLRDQNAIVREGVQRGNAFLGDYLSLDGFEQGVFRRMVPFYPWAKAMTMLAFRLPFLASTKAFAWNRLSAALMSLVHDNELPEYMKDYLPVFARENGDTVWLKMGGYLPFSNLRVAKFGDVPVPNLLAFWEANPMVSLGYKLIGGRTMFEPSKVPYGESLVNVANGDVYEFTEQGTLRKTIPQTPLIQGVAHMFPAAQLIENLISPAAVTKRNWYGFPEPVMNPDGSYKYPKELLDRIGPMLGLGIATRNAEQAKLSERIKVRQAIVAMRKAYRRADPDEREYLRTTLEDYARGEYRRIEAQ